MRFPRQAAPPLAMVEQQLAADQIDNPREHTRSALIGAGLPGSFKAGGRIAITAGSRGMGGLTEILAGIGDAVREAGGEPFVIPAMGSHGGATAEGQETILRMFGVHELGMPIRSTMDTIALGPADNGAVAHMDRYAAEADGIIVLGRLKTHPESAEELASGLLKMSTVGLGKQAGAREAHSHGLWESVRAVPKVQLARAGVLFGVAVVENAYRRPLRIEVAPGNYDAFLDTDTRLLAVAKQHLAQIPFRRLDLLIVDRIGKNISGAGMDPNVIGQWKVSGGRRDPDYRRIAALSLTPESLGNGLGIGLADVTTRRFAEAYDPETTYINMLTASEPDNTTREAPLPLALPSDRDAIEVALASSIPADPPRVCRIRDTADLSRLWVSEALLDEARSHAGMRILSGPEPMAFNAKGDLF